VNRCGPGAAMLEIERGAQQYNLMTFKRPRRLERGGDFVLKLTRIDIELQV